MLTVHLFVTYAHVNVCHFFSSSWCRGLAAASACGSSWTFLFTFLLVRHIVFVGNAQKSPIGSHLKGLDPSLSFCCQGPGLTGIKEGV